MHSFKYVKRGCQSDEIPHPKMTFAGFMLGLSDIVKSSVSWLGKSRNVSIGGDSKSAKNKGGKL